MKKSTVQSFKDTNILNPSAKSSKNAAAIPTKGQTPLTISSLGPDSLQFYEISSPYMIILETCREKESFYGVYQFSQNKYFNHSQAFQTIMESEYRPSKRPLHQHSYIEIMYVLSGEVTNRVENQIFTYAAGQCCVMNKNIRHSEEFSGNFQVAFLMLRDDFMQELLDEYTQSASGNHPGMPEHPIFQLYKDSRLEKSQYDRVYLDYFPLIPAEEILEQMSPLFNFIIRESMDSRPGSTFFTKGAFSRVLLMLNDPDLFSINRIHSDSASPEYLFTKIAHIMRTSHGRCTRQELSDKLHYNGEYLNRIVRKFTGKSILEYGQSIYLEEARKMLADTDKSISQIISDLNFSNRSHFYRLFEKYYHETPMDYRKRSASGTASDKEA